MGLSIAFSFNVKLFALTLDPASLVCCLSALLKITDFFRIFLASLWLTLEFGVSHFTHSLYSISFTLNASFFKVSTKYFISLLVLHKLLFSNYSFSICRCFSSHSLLMEFSLSPVFLHSCLLSSSSEMYSISLSFFYWIAASNWSIILLFCKTEV